MRWKLLESYKTKVAVLHSFTQDLSPVELHWFYFGVSVTGPLLEGLWGRQRDMRQVHDMRTYTLPPSQALWTGGNISGCKEFG